jgi:hypothetical protein
MLCYCKSHVPPPNRSRSKLRERAGDQFAKGLGTPNLRNTLAGAGIGAAARQRKKLLGFRNDTLDDFACRRDPAWAHSRLIQSPSP